MDNLGKILKHIRVFNYLKQVDLAKKLKISRSYISGIENNNKTPSMEILQNYSNSFNIPLSAILLFAENYDNKKELKLKIKSLVTKITIKFLDWICKQEEKK